MNATPTTTLFHRLNALVEPTVRAGWLSPGITPTGLILLETTGRRSGRTHNTPLLATLVLDYAVVSTVRSDSSQWLRNLAATPDARYWLGGRPRECRAYIVGSDERAAALDAAPAAIRCLATNLASTTKSFGWSFALLAPAKPVSISLN